jgi:hypothetical protein
LREEEVEENINKKEKKIEEEGKRRKKGEKQ